MVLGLIIANLLVILLFVVGVIVYRKYLISADKVVKDLKERGKSITEILEFAKEKRLNLKEVKLYYLLYFFEDLQNSGYDLTTIKESALSSGWPQDLVDVVYNKLKNI